ncbi:MAG: 50S ribosomal protein L4, partial [Finegoldia magna]|nr:50S ribosomal protein L4 [Finegoldia magna]
MPKVQILNQQGENVGELELNEAIFGVDVNEHVVYEVVKNQLANKRQGTQSAKTRSEVRGGGRKPWRQKGTGRARQGSIRSPQWRGGGVVFAPKPRDYSYAVPKKVRRLAIKSVLTEKVNDNEMIVLDKLNLDAISTKKAVEVLKDARPMVYGATKENYKDMIEVVKGASLPLGVKAGSLEELYETVELIQAAGYKELVLDVTGENIKDTYTNAIQVRRTALKEQDRTFGYPSIVFANRLSNSNPMMEVALSSIFTIKYGSIIVIDDISYAKALPLFALRQNIYTDPQRPMRVEPKIYPINNPDENSPVLVTVDF